MASPKGSATAGMRGQSEGSSSSDDERLKRFIEERALLLDEDGGFELASGRTSSYLFNVKNLFSEPEASSLLTDKLLATLDELEFDYIAGLELGAVFPICCAVLRSQESDRPVRGFVIRKETKEHGTENRIEGLPTLPSGGRVVVVDDVTTTGSSLLEAVEVVRGIGCTVEEAVAIVDREEGARENLASNGVELVPLFTREDFDGVIP